MDRRATNYTIILVGGLEVSLNVAKTNIGYGLQRLPDAPGALTDHTSLTKIHLLKKRRKKFRWFAINLPPSQTRRPRFELGYSRVKRSNSHLRNRIVGLVGFEPTTSRTQTVRATRLRHKPIGPHP